MPKQGERRDTALAAADRMERQALADGTARRYDSDWRWFLERCGELGIQLPQLPARGERATSNIVGKANSAAIVASYGEATRVALADAFECDNMSIERANLRVRAIQHQLGAVVGREVSLKVEWKPLGDMIAGAGRERHERQAQAPTPAAPAEASVAGGGEEQESAMLLAARTARAVPLEAIAALLIDAHEHRDTRTPVEVLTAVAAATQFYGAFRISELLALRWSDIVLTNDIEYTMVYVATTKTRRSGEWRHIAPVSCDGLFAASATATSSSSAAAATAATRRSASSSHAATRERTKRLSDAAEICSLHAWLLWWRADEERRRTVAQSDPVFARQARHRRDTSSTPMLDATSPQALTGVERGAPTIEAIPEDTYRNQLRSALARAGARENERAPHSLRRAAAVVLQHGSEHAEAALKALGRWESTANALVYANASDVSDKANATRLATALFAEVVRQLERKRVSSAPRDDAAVSSSADKNVRDS